MNAKLMQNRQTRSIATAMGAAILAAVATMFVPAAILENITGASGLSELVPATAAPLGDTARALIAFGTGALTLAVMAMLLVRQSKVVPVSEAAKIEAVRKLDQDGTVFLSSLKQWVTKIQLPKMPWIKGDDDITDLSDLPKLRDGDIHPDAPARRPLSATKDLPVLDLIEISVDPVIEVPPEMETTVVTEPVRFVTEVPLSKPFVEPQKLDYQPSLSEMVAQLEASVAQRKQQLAELELVAANLAASKFVDLPAKVEVVTGEPTPPTVQIETPAVQARPEWPPLEAVPATPAQQDEMDEALAAALATLHRMNGTGR